MSAYDKAMEKLRDSNPTKEEAEEVLKRLEMYDLLTPAIDSIQKDRSEVKNAVLDYIKSSK